ncbi:tetratricopeptide repeat protein [uncultured Duncaniella sp.]|jgi:tetratricopeptide (TPR) repeat protein|uniref:tetratricopeptide repeat protein n=1 Tax=uncultured Duncaniella sp. TaxID=2768039 RepID=UPI000F4AD738|nr:tetratricopeptide repeat protein [uncultured Duncaniella sp.]ROS89220.1 tetratricopeptide repeat protein [Muribaculaceae bacterium Isolate-080 (Janvier)]
MANNKPVEETRNSIDEVNDTLTGIGEKVQSNPKVIVWGCIAVAAVVAVILIYVYAIRQPGQNAANNALGQADIELLMGNDSVALAKYQQVAADHGYDAGNLANLNAAIILYKEGKYEEAIGYLKNYSASESVIGASAKSLEGDCYVNLKQYPQAIDCFKQAVKISDNNPHYTPAFLLKEATVLREQKDFKAEAAVYEQILKDYPTYGSEIGVDIKKYLERAQDAAK